MTEANRERRLLVGGLELCLRSSRMSLAAFRVVRLIQRHTILPPAVHPATTWHVAKAQLFRFSLSSYVASEGVRRGR